MATRRKPKYIQIRPQINPKERNGDFTGETLPPGFSGAGDRVIHPPVRINTTQSKRATPSSAPVTPKKMTFVAKK